MKILHRFPRRTGGNERKWRGYDRFGALQVGGNAPYLEGDLLGLGQGAGIHLPIADDEVFGHGVILAQGATGFFVGASIAIAAKRSPGTAWLPAEMMAVDHREDYRHN
jgi:hypothetical protein